ncbi:hypothetical protein HGRIS_010524 [Hohenbuehelia grisea]|uniref:Antibiotic biosynthesis monooxygenase n=1 Tax=Hohenbuehelia grisea TaxID=104357 RepID=A0ABR3IXC1_9AGAR
MSEAKLGFLVPLVAKANGADDVVSFLLGGHKLVQAEPETLHWYALKFEGAEPSKLAIFDTFAGESGQTAHLQGQVAAALMGKAPELLGAAPEIKHVKVLASKVKASASLDDETAGLACGLQVTFTAKPDKVEAVREFLINAKPIVEAEEDTPVWYAIEFDRKSDGSAGFGIVDFFPSSEGRQAHLSGKVAAALFGSAAELLAGTPEVAKFDVVATKV